MGVFDFKGEDNNVDTPEKSLGINVSKEKEQPSEEQLGANGNTTASLKEQVSEEQLTELNTKMDKMLCSDHGQEIMEKVVGKEETLEVIENRKGELKEEYTKEKTGEAIKEVNDKVGKEVIKRGVTKKAKKGKKNLVYGEPDSYNQKHFTEEDFFRTGIAPLDAMLGGGYRKGGIVEFAGWNNVGKTTMILKGVADAQRKGIKVCYVDTEKALDNDRLIQLGCNPKKMDFIQTDVIEEGFQFIKASVEKGARFVVFDSVGAAMPRGDTKSELGEKRMMGRASMYTTVLNQIKGIIHETKSVLILVNQYYATADKYAPKKTKGGEFIGYVCSQRLEVIGNNTKSKQESVDKDSSAQCIKVHLAKTKCFRPVNFGSIELIVQYDTGVIRELLGIMEMLRAFDILVLDGKKYSYFGEEIGMKQKFINWLVVNKEEAYEDLRLRSTDMYYQRECFKKLDELYPF